MDLVKRFSPQAGNDGVFQADIDFIEQFMGKHFGAERGKAMFLSKAKKVCHELGMVMGYNETSTGFTLGFESKADHDRFMAQIEPQMALAAQMDQRSTERLLQHMDWFEQLAAEKT